jgi:DNA-binding MarR family transcriptional regulator
MPKPAVLVEQFMRIANLVAASEDETRRFGTRFPLSKAEIHTIEAVGDHPGISVTELAALRGISKSAASQVLARLKAKSMVDQSPAAGSARDTSLELTREGAVAYRRHAAYHRKLYEAIEARLAALPPSFTGELEELLREIEDRISG